MIQNFVIESSQRTAGQSGVNLDHLYTFQVYLPSKEEQEKVVADLDKKFAALEELKTIRKVAQNKINQLLADVWGAEYFEIAEEVITEELADENAE